MRERLLVPYDGSPLSERALERAATTHPTDAITVLYVIDPVLAIYEAEIEGLEAAKSWHDRMQDRANRLCDDATEQAAAHDCDISTAVEIGDPGREILNYVDAHDVDHVVMGSHGRSGISRLILGSVAERVMRQSPVPVTVVR